jgi:hypothetical protein
MLARVSDAFQKVSPTALFSSTFLKMISVANISQLYSFSSFSESPENLCN